MDSNSDSMTPTGTLSVMASTTGVIDASGATWKSASSVTADILNTGSVLGTGSYEPQATTASHADPTQLQSSYSATITDSSQFPMQHATQQLPSNGVPMVTTDMVSRTSDFQQTSQFLSDTDTVSASGFSISSVSLSVSASVLDLDIASASVTESQNVSPMVTGVNSALETQSESLADQFDVIIDKPTVVSSKSITDSVVYDPNMNTESIQASVTGSILVTSTGSIAQNVPLDSSLALDPSVSATSYYEATSRDLYSTFTASETTFSAAPGVVDSAVSLSTSAAVPLPPITVKPVQPTPKGQSTILGGGISDNILYIGASVGGVVLIVILLICVVCIRRRKNKHKGSLKKEEEQDLWMNSAVDIPLSVKNPFPGSNGSGSLTRKKDIAAQDHGDSADTNLRQRKHKRPARKQKAAPENLTTQPEPSTGVTELIPLPSPIKKVPPESTFSCGDNVNISLKSNEESDSEKRLEKTKALDRPVSEKRLDKAKELDLAVSEKEKMTMGESGNFNTLAESDNAEVCSKLEHVELESIIGDGVRQKRNIDQGDGTVKRSKVDNIGTRGLAAPGKRKVALLSDKPNTLGKTKVKDIDDKVKTVSDAKPIDEQKVKAKLAIKKVTTLDNKNTNASVDNKNTNASVDNKNTNASVDNKATISNDNKVTTSGDNKIVTSNDKTSLILDDKKVKVLDDVKVISEDNQTKTKATTLTLDDKKVVPRDENKVMKDNQQNTKATTLTLVDKKVVPRDENKVMNMDDDFMTIMEKFANLNYDVVFSDDDDEDDLDLELGSDKAARPLNVHAADIGDIDDILDLDDDELGLDDDNFDLSMSLANRNMSMAKSNKGGAKSDVGVSESDISLDDSYVYEELVSGEGMDSLEERDWDSIFEEKLVELHSDEEENEGCTRYEAVFDFQGSHGNHLTLRQGDIVHVLRKEETGWWQGSLGVKSGWFPSNYVQSAPPDKVSTENEVELHKGSSPNVSSFMLRKTPEREDQYSYPTEEEIGAEPIYCKIQPKDKRSDKSSDRSSRSTSSTPTKSEPPTTPSNNYITPISDSSHEYRVLYTYEGRNPGELTINKGDIVMCKDNDKSGWMKGTNCTTRKEGWCPTSYLKKIEKHVKEGSAVLAPDPNSYHQLEVNTQPGDKQDLVGIVHKATHTFSAEKAGDLEFDCGDYVTVFQILENGWWLGSKDKTVGWFPGSYVEMIEQPSSSPSPSISTHSSSTTDSPFLPEEHPKGDSPIPTSTITIPSTTPSTPTVSKTPSKLKPVRKAPPPPLKIQPKGQQTPPIPAKTHPISDTTPPTSLKRPRPTNDTTPPSSLRKPGSDSKLPTPAGGNKTPKPTGRPRIPPPAPPTRGVAREMGVVNPVTDMLADEGDDNVEPYYESLRNVENDNTYDDIKIDDKASTDDHSAILTKKEKIKPPVPKRYIKPKLVTVPRTEVKLPELPGLANLMKLRSPPPPKPVTPKLGPIRAKLSAPKSLEDQIPSVEDDTYFHVNSQRKFQDIVRKDSSEYESRSSESPPYRTVSSFGSSFGGNSFGNSFGKQPDEPTAKPVKAVQPMAKPVSSNIHKELESDKPEQQATQSSVKAADKSAIIEEAEPTVVSKDSSSIGSTPSNQTQAEDRINNKVNIVCDNQIDNQMHEQSIVAAEIKDTNDTKVNKDDSKPKSGIPLAPKMKASKLPPPKHNLSNIKPESPKLVANAIENEAKPTTPTERVSKLPKSKEAVSKLPAKTSQDQNIFQYPQVTPSKENISGDSVENTDKDNVVNNTVETIPDAQVPIAPSTNTQNEVKDLRPRTESFGRPPVAPKPKSKLKPPSIKTSETTSDKGKVADVKTDIQNIEESLGNPSPKTPNALSPVVTSSSIPSPKIPVPSSSLQSPKMPVSNPRRTSDSDGTSQTIKTDSDNDTKDTKSPQSDTAKPQSKMPLPSTITQKSPKIPRGRKSQLPSAGVRKPSKDRAKEPTQDSNTAEVVPVVESPPSSNIKTKPESSQMSRIQSPKTPVSAEQKSLRNRSSSPANRKGIPTSMRNRSNSPASKQSNLPTAGSAGSKSIPKQKRSGLVAPKKVLNGPSSGPKQNSIDGDSSHSPSTQNDDDKITQDKDADSSENSENKSDRPSKPPRVPKQSSQDSKSRKHGKSLLPMIHKSMEAGNGTQNGLSSPSQGNKHKRGIPVPKSVAKQAAPPKSPTSTNGSQTVGGLAKTLYQAVKGYTAQSEDELSFVEGTFIKELSDCDRSGWFVGMLADGTTGIYPADHFKPSPVSAQSEA